MKIFFSMRHSGAIRNFESVIRSLCEHGHELHLSFLLRDKLGDERMAQGDERMVTRLSREFPSITFDWIPKRSPSGSLSAWDKGNHLMQVPCKRKMVLVALPVAGPTRCH